MLSFNYQNDYQIVAGFEWIVQDELGRQSYVTYCYISYFMDDVGCRWTTKMRTPSPPEKYYKYMNYNDNTTYCLGYIPHSIPHNISVVIVKLVSFFCFLELLSLLYVGFCTDLTIQSIAVICWRATTRISGIAARERSTPLPSAAPLMRSVRAIKNIIHTSIQRI